MRRVALLLLLCACIENDLAYDTPITRPYQADPDDLGDIPADAPVGGVSGQICAPNGITWVVGAAVWIDHAYGKTVAFTDRDGRFELAPVPAGRQVVHVSKGSFSASFPVWVDADVIVELDQQRCLANDLSIAVVAGQYDHVQVLLTDLGFTPEIIPATGATALLRDPARLDGYDVVFFNCGLGDGWTAHADEVADNLRDYVHGGGSIYASDWAYWLVERAFPEIVDFAGDDAVSRDALRGRSSADPVRAVVRDPDMVTALDSVYADIRYPVGDWAEMLAAGDDDDVLLEGTTTWTDVDGPHEVTGPLAVRRAVGDGTVLFTSFHNEAQPTSDMLVVLREIVLSL